MVAYLSAREAARRLRVSDKTVRAWVRSGRILADTSGRSFRIDADQVATLAADLAADGRAEVADSAPAYDFVRHLEEHVADLRGQLEARTREVAELHMLLAQAQRALPAPELMESHVAGAPRNGASETSHQPAEQKHRPWWRVW